MSRKMGKWLIVGGFAIVILAIGMFGLTFYMMSGTQYRESMIVGNLGTIFLIMGIVVMIIGEVILRHTTIRLRLQRR